MWAVSKRRVHNEPRPSRHSQRTIIYVSTLQYCLAWWFVFVAHLATALFVSCAALAHLLLSLPTVHVNTSALLVPLSIKQVSGFAYLAISLAHFVAVGRMLTRSLYQRRLTMGYRRDGASSRQSTANDLAPVRLLPQQPIRFQWIRRLARWLLRLWRAVFGPTGYFGIDGPLFIPSLIFREVVEIAMQSYQLWMLSYYVSRPWISRMAVGAVVANCWSLSIINWLVPTESRRRLLMLVVDMYLDFSCVVVVPACIIVPYLVTFDWEGMQWSTELLVDDIWFTNAIAEATHVLITSYWDFFSSLLPQWSIFSCLQLIKRMVKRAAVPRLDAYPRAVVPHESQQDTTDHRRTATLSSTPTREAVIVRPVGEPEPPHRESRSVTIATMCISLYGVVVLALHCHAVTIANSRSLPGCSLYVQPWLATNISCKVHHINCHRAGINGTADEVTAILSQIERDVLTKLVFDHCPSASIPSYTTHFRSLRVMEFFNSTLAYWSPDAPITRSRHPAFTSFTTHLTYMPRLPDALLHRELPESLVVISFFNSSLSELPADLADLWGDSRFNRIGLEGMPISQLPRGFGEITFVKLWMTSNRFTHFPDDMFASARFQSIRLSGNPLQRLPETMGDTSILVELLVEHTNVSVLPSWVWSWLDSRSVNREVLVSFFGSPVCDSGLDAATTALLCAYDTQSQYGSFRYELVRDEHPL